jgi:hypothetical protein
MEWKTIPKDTLSHRVRDFLPKDNQFLVLWKGIISICEYDEKDDAFWICHFPAYIGEWKLSKEREGKITHFCLLEFPADY